MPTTRTRRARTWQAELDEHHQQALLQGPQSVLLAAAGYHNCSANHFAEITDADWQAGLDEMRRDWTVHREALLADWKALHGPTSRPWAWWQFDATEAQRSAANMKIGTQHD